jgi:hypothetical protein
MPFYLTRFRYTPETWARLVKHPEDRRARCRIDGRDGDRPQRRRGTGIVSYDGSNDG